MRVLQGLTFDIVKSNFDEDLDKSLFSGADGKVALSFRLPTCLWTEAVLLATVVITSGDFEVSSKHHNLL